MHAADKNNVTLKYLYPVKAKKKPTAIATPATICWYFLRKASTHLASAAAAGASGFTAGTGAGAVDVFVVKTSSVVAHLKKFRLNRQNKGK